MPTRVTIVVDVEEDAMLHAKIMDFCRDNRLGRYTEQLVHDAIQKGAIVNEIRSGRADISYGPIPKEFKKSI